MNQNNNALSEQQWLNKVLEEARRQYEANQTSQEKAFKEAITAQREMWEDVGVVSISNGLDQIADFMSHIQTMKNQKRQYEFIEQMDKKFKKMMLSPYFGRIDFQETDETQASPYYIGESTLVDEAHDFLVYDWRAPLSSMFYDFEVGPAHYTCPEGIVEGQLTLKRQYKIEEGQMLFNFDSSLKIDDDILQGILAKSADEKMRTIVNSIQKEQNKVIRNEDFKHLIVQGPAGSGKTSIAMHRIAYLLYKHRDQLSAQNVLVFSPNDIFGDYISNVLPELGEENVTQTTFMDYLHHSLGKSFEKESYFDMMEYTLSNAKHHEFALKSDNIAFKASLACLNALKTYGASLTERTKKFEDIVYRGHVVMTAKAQQNLFFEECKAMPLIKRYERLKGRILFLLEPYEQKSFKEIKEELIEKGGYLSISEVNATAKRLVRESIQSIHEQINRMTHINYSSLYIEFLKAHSPKALANHTIRKMGQGILPYEDQAPFLLLKGICGAMDAIHGIKYIIIDEAQDYSPLQYELLRMAFPKAGMTLLGDINQSIHPTQNVGSYKHLEDVFPMDSTCWIELTKSYRSTIEITAFTKKLLKNSFNADSVERHGDKPKMTGFKNHDDMIGKMSSDMKHYSELGHHSIGILTKTVSEARQLFEQLKSQVDLPIHCLSHEDDAYDSGIVVMPVYLAKGLEFDAVMLYNAGTDNYSAEKDRLLFYTACTRALHVLNIYYMGEFYFSEALEMAEETL